MQLIKKNCTIYSNSYLIIIDCSETSARIKNHILLTEIGIGGERPLIEKILVAFDGSNQSDRALDFALDLARKYSAQLVLINVIPFSPISEASVVIPYGIDYSTVYKERKCFHEKLLEEAFNKAKTFQKTLERARMFGDIEGLGTYTGNWAVKNAGTPDAEPNTVAIVLIKDALVAGIGTGDLKIKAMDMTYKIISATGDLAGLKGEGTIEMLTPVSYSYSIEAQINP